MRFGSGLVVVRGALIFLYAVLVPREREVISPVLSAPAE